MIDFIKDLVEEAKVSDNHTAVKSMTYSDMMAAVKKYNNSFENFNKELSEYMERNGCLFSYVADGTRIPRIIVKYRGFQSDNMFDGAEFRKVYMTRDGHKALYLTKESDIHKLCIDNGVVLYYNGDGTYSCFNESDEFEPPKQYRDYDIVGEWNEPIDEKELHMLAEEKNPYEFIGFCETFDADRLHLVFNEGFEMGYRKAKGL